MKKGMKKLLLMILAAVLITAPVFTAGTTNVEAASKIKINRSKATINRGKCTTLKVVGTRHKPKWHSSKKSVATVNSKGIVTAKKAGKTTITATIGNRKYKSIVTVKNHTHHWKAHRTTKQVSNRGYGWHGGSAHGWGHGSGGHHHQRRGHAMNQTCIDYYYCTCGARKN